MKFLCYFNVSYYGTNKSCSIVYEPMESGVDCLISLRNKSEFTSTLTLSNQAIITPSYPIKDDTTYCFIAKGRLLSMTIAIEGDFVLGELPIELHVYITCTHSYALIYKVHSFYFSMYSIPYAIHIENCILIS